MEGQTEDKPGWHCCQLGRMPRGVEAGREELEAELLGSQVAESMSQGGGGRMARTEGGPLLGPCSQGQWQRSARSVHLWKPQTWLNGSCHINSRSFKERDTNWSKEFLKSVLASWKLSAGRKTLTLNSFS